MAATTRLGWVAIGCALGIVACGGKVESEDEAPNAGDAGRDSTPQPATFADPFAPGEAWHGAYTCEQGLTQLDLRIVAMHDDAIDDAVFAFDWTSGGAVGSFHMTGAFDPATGIATLEPGAWIKYPATSTWATVGMRGTADAASYAGAITHAGCGAFTLTRP